MLIGFEQGRGFYEVKDVPDWDEGMDGDQRLESLGFSTAGKSFNAGDGDGDWRICPYFADNKKECKWVAYFDLGDSPTHEVVVRTEVDYLALLTLLAPLCLNTISARISELVAVIETISERPMPLTLI